VTLFGYIVGVDLQLDNMDFTLYSKKWLILFKEEGKKILNSEVSLMVVTNFVIYFLKLSCQVNRR